MVYSMTEPDLAYLKARQADIDRLLDDYLPPAEAYPQILHQAMRYSVLAGGKRLRPILAITAYESFGARNPHIINPAACALEFIHTYSLIHDDLPCMDDDDLRRGQPTLHKKFDEATAVLAGDALHDLAFELMARTGSARAVEELARAIGTEGMIGGQLADVAAEGKDITLDEIIYIHTHKTGALIRGSLRIAAILAGVNEATLARLSLYGEKIGLAFQIVDDILDVKGDQKELGKKIGSDRKNKKATYPGTVGLEKAGEDVEQLVDEAIEICREFDLHENYFELIARFIGQRRH